VAFSPHIQVDLQQVSLYSNLHKDTFVACYKYVERRDFVFVDVDTS
jgi:hypothetical protein